MNKKSFRSYVVNILTFVVLLLFIVPSIIAQEGNSSDKSLADLFENFKAAKKLPCGQREEAIRVGKEIILKHGADKANKEVIEYVKSQTARLEAEEKNCHAEFSLENLFEKFMAASKTVCGSRSEAIPVGKLILDRYGDDRENREVIAFVKKRIEVIEREDPVCRRELAYIAAFKAKNWAAVFATGRIIIDAEGDKPKPLDVMLDLVSVGYDLTAYEKADSYNIETVNYALKAIELIENGVKTQGCWGAFNCYKNKEKTLGWLNYIVGYISYFRLKGDNKALPYFYKSTQYQMEFKYDAFIYQAVAIYYFDRQASIASGLEINSFINRAQNLSVQPGETGNGFAEGSAENIEIATLYKQLVNLYNLRYNLEPNENVTDLADYIQKLISRPLIEPSANPKK